MAQCKVKKLSLLFFVGLLFLSAPFFALANSVSLGSFGLQATSEKFYKDINLDVAGTNYVLPANEISKFIREREQLVFNPLYFSEIENTDFCGQKKSMACELLLGARVENHIQKISSINLDEALLNQYLTTLSQQTDKDPQNAKIQVQDGPPRRISVFALSEDGLKLNEEKSLQLLTEYFKNQNDSGKVALAYDTVTPDISTSDIDNLGVTALIGEGTSNFAGSPKNRIANIKVAIKRFDGVFIKPGEEFSFVKTLGPVDGSTGYLPELVIKGDKTEPDFGGGICQVSTTAFRAAIYSGLKITARTPHAYPVGYYNPQGMDATVYVPNPDLKFINNTPGPILIQVRIEGTRLIFDFYGTDDGRKINVTGPTITEKNPDGSMKATFTQEVLDKDGNTVIDQVFNSAYESPSKFPHPGQETFTEKPKDWSKKQWNEYKKTHNL
jgi:vancomycin resistance protein YoaR